MCRSTPTKRFNSISNMDTIATPSSGLTSIPAMDLTFEFQSRPFIIANPEITTYLVNPSKPMDGTTLVTCCSCGSGPSVGDIAPACTGCGHQWDGCYYCTVSD